MSAIKNKRCLVTGGAGFIGSHLVDTLLEQGAASVSVVDNFFLGKKENLEKAGGNVTIHNEDAAEFAALAAVIDQEKPDIVFNLATKALLYSFFNPAGACRVNLDIALNLGDLLKAGQYERLVHFSSSEVYGTAQQNPMPEDHPLNAETSYAAGKAAADLALKSYANMFNLPVLMIRPFNNYGPRQNDGNLAAIIPLTVKRIMSGEKPVLQGDGLQTRDYIYVQDTIDATLKLCAGANFNGEVYNLGSGTPTAIKDLINAICKVMDYNGDIIQEETRVADVRDHCADMTKARNVIGEFLSTSLEDGLNQTINWYRDVK